MTVRSNAKLDPRSSSMKNGAVAMRHSDDLGTTSSDDEDSDLADLLGQQRQQQHPQQQHVIAKNGNNSRVVHDDYKQQNLYGNAATADMNLDHLTSGKQHHVKKRQQSFSYYHGQGGTITSNLWGHISAYLSMLCYFYPRSCGVLAFLVVSALVFLIGQIVLNPTQQFGHIAHDHTNIQSKYDLSIGNVDHWCLAGGNDGCACEDPLQPLARLDRPSWVQAFKANLKMLKALEMPLTTTTTTASLSSTARPPIDVAFLGESIVEEMDGRWMGMKPSEGLTDIQRTFHSHFKKKQRSQFEGVALGIAGDTAPNVLWRLLHGETPDHFQPRVWWLVLGNNDLGRMQCSEEIVVLGILRVVEEIMDRRPNAIVVINSLFPMITFRGGAYPLLHDFEDSFSKQGVDQDRLVVRRQPRVNNSENNNRRHRALFTPALKEQSTFTTDQQNRMQQAQEQRMVASSPNSIFKHSARTIPRDAVPLPAKKSLEQRVEEIRQQEEIREQIVAKHGLLRSNRSPDADRFGGTVAGREYHRPGPMGLRRSPSDPVNPVMRDQKRTRKYNLLHRPRQLPYWTAIRAINRELKKFVDKHHTDSNNNKRLYFFDADDIFVSRDDVGKRTKVRSDLISIRGHPTQKGFYAWEEEIIVKMKQIKAENPQSFIDDVSVPTFASSNRIRQPPALSNTATATATAKSSDNNNNTNYIGQAVDDGFEGYEDAGGDDEFDFMDVDDDFIDQDLFERTKDDDFPYMGTDSDNGDGANYDDDHNNNNGNA